MTEAPERIWAIFQPHHVKGQEPYVHASCSPTRGAKYLHENHVADLLKAEREKALREAQSMVTMRIVQAAGGGENLLSPSDVWQGIEALISEDKTDGDA